MIFNRKYSAFSLTELLIVLTIIAILFAASAPIISKSRLKSDSNISEEVWNYVSGTSSNDVYYDPGIPRWTSTLYLGLVPSYNVDFGTPAKFVINANNQNPGSGISQNQIQFRYGEGDGYMTGIFRVDSDGNLALTSGGYGWRKNPSAIKSSDPNYGGATVIGSFMGSADLSEGIFIGNFFNDEDFNPDNSSYSPVFINGQTSDFYAGVDDYRITNIGSGVGGRAGVGEYNLRYPACIGAMYYCPQGGVSIGKYSKSGNDYNWGLTIGYNACHGISTMSSNSYNNISCIGGTNPVSDPDNDEYRHKLTVDKDSSYMFIGAPSTSDNANFPPNMAVLEIYMPKNESAKNFDIISSSGSEGKVPSTSVILNSNLVVKGGFYVNDDSSTSINNPIVLQNAGWIKRLQSERYFDPFYRGDDAYGNLIVDFGRYLGSGDFKSETPLSSSVFYNDNYKSSWSNCTVDKMFASDSAFKACLTNVSDGRLKDVSSENFAGLDSILKLDPQNYLYKSDDAKTPHVGVIAQSLMKVFPDAVTKDKNGYYSIRWDDMFFALINSLKQLNTKIVNIMSNLTSMSNDIEDIKSSHSDIKNKIKILNSRVSDIEKQKRSIKHEI